MCDHHNQSALDHSNTMTALLEKISKEVPDHKAKTDMDKMRAVGLRGWLLVKWGIFLRGTPHFTNTTKKNFWPMPKAFCLYVMTGVRRCRCLRR